MSITKIILRLHGQQNIKICHVCFMFYFSFETYRWSLTFCWPCISVYLSQYLTNLMHKICFTISFYFTPIAGRLVHETASYRCDDTRGCVMQFWPPDDEHMCSKHVEAWNKTCWDKHTGEVWLQTIPPTVFSFTEHFSASRPSSLHFSLLY